MESKQAKKLHMVISPSIVSYLDYNFSWFKGAEEQKCMCGALKCRGFIRKKNAAPGTKIDVKKLDPKTKATQSKKTTKLSQAAVKPVNNRVNKKLSKVEVTKSANNPKSKLIKLTAIKPSGLPNLRPTKVKRVLNGRVTKVTKKKVQSKVKNVKRLMEPVFSTKPKAKKADKSTLKSRKLVVSKDSDRQKRRQSDISTSTANKGCSPKRSSTKQYTVSTHAVYDTVWPR